MYNNETINYDFLNKRIYINLFSKYKLFFSDESFIMIHLIISSIIKKLKKDFYIIILKYYYLHNIQSTSEADIITHWDWKKENILIIIILK